MENAAAHRLGLSHSTVKHHLANARSKVGAETTAALTACIVAAVAYLAATRVDVPADQRGGDEAAPAGGWPGAQGGQEVPRGQQLGDLVQGQYADRGEGDPEQGGYEAVAVHAHTVQRAPVPAVCPG